MQNSVSARKARQRAGDREFYRKSRPNDEWPGLPFCRKSAFLPIPQRQLAVALWPSMA
jgi:hypothetical protein